MKPIWKKYKMAGSGAYGGFRVIPIRTDYIKYTIKSIKILQRKEYILSEEGEFRCFVIRMSWMG